MLPQMCGLFFVLCAGSQTCVKFHTDIPVFSRFFVRNACDATGVHARLSLSGLAADCCDDSYDTAHVVAIVVLSLGGAALSIVAILGYSGWRNRMERKAGFCPIYFPPFHTPLMSNLCSIP